MNVFAKHFEGAAKHLPLNDKKPNQINKADVAELVDARDLKCPAAFDLVGLFCKTDVSRPAETGGDPAHLQNIFRSYQSSRSSSGRAGG